MPHATAQANCVWALLWASPSPWRPCSVRGQRLQSSAPALPLLLWRGPALLLLLLEEEGLGLGLLLLLEEGLLQLLQGLQWALLPPPPAPLLQPRR